MGLDGHGEPVHSSMYRHLWSNGPKECLEFADYSFDEHFGRPISSFPPREVLFDYIKGRVEKSDVRQYVSSTPSPATPATTKPPGNSPSPSNLKTGITETHIFDKLVVATGHFHVPAVPEFKASKPSPAKSCTPTTSAAPNASTANASS
nr:hypothetical protein [Arthrobacter sp. QXT-31]